MHPNQSCNQELTLPDIASILGIAPDTALRWAVAGRLSVGRQGCRTIIRVASSRTFTNPQPDRLLIVTHPLPWSTGKVASPGAHRFSSQ